MKKFLRFAFFFAITFVFWGILFAVSMFLLGCKTRPIPAAETPVPSLSLVFHGVEAVDPVHLGLNYTLEIENPFPVAGRARIESWQVEINKKSAVSGFSLEAGADNEFALKAALPGTGGDTVGSTGGNSVPALNSIPLRLNMDVDVLSGEGLAPADDYSVNLILNLAFSSGLSPPVKIKVSGIGTFPGVRPPVFSITAIAILKAELINTRFRVGLKIENPNPFPVELSSFGYELYGNGRLWADGMEKNIIKVPGKSSVDGNLFLLMNFINMKRDLLDQVINLVDVNYRFTGEAQVGTGVDYLHDFKTGFDLSGYSKVYDN
ncbi:MAG: LEA type 2 family protein [Treponema sp.]|nr:LEA type 2 family protein [Treponema sp.]